MKIKTLDTLNFEIELETLNFELKVELQTLNFELETRNSPQYFKL